MEKVSGYFVASAGPDNIECGFVPDEVHCISALGGTELEFSFFKILADLAASGQYGFTYSTTGVPDPAASGSGIATYDTSSPKLAFDNPTGDGPDVYADFPAAFEAGTTSPTARTGSAIGTITKPSIGNENGLVAECTASAGVFGTEPTWPTRPGDTVSDGTNTWTMRETKIVQAGVKGFTVQAGIASDGELWVFTAEKHDRYENMGDLDVENPARFRSQKP